MTAEELFELEELRALLIRGKLTAPKALRFKQLLYKYYQEAKKNILKETPEMIRLRKYEEDINNLIRRIENGELRLYPNSDSNEFLLNILKDIGKGV